MPRRPGGPRPNTRGTRRFKQQRAQATYEALLTASAALFAERGYDATQTPDIAEQAGVSTGAFYRYFDDKRHAFLETVANYVERATTDIFERLNVDALAGADRDQVIERVVDVTIAHVRGQRALERVCIAKALEDDDVAALRGQLDKTAVERIAAVIEALTSRQRIPDAYAAARTIHLATTAVAHERAGLMPPIGAKISDGAIRGALTNMITIYLFGGDPVAASAASASASRGRSAGTRAATSRSSRRGE